MTSQPAELAVVDLHKEYPTPSEPLVVIRDVSFEMRRGEALAIMGPSGSGKSTLLYIIGALESPTRGTVTVGARNPFELPEAELAAFRNQQVGFVFQEHHLLPQCSALENVLIPRSRPGPLRQARRQSSGLDGCSTAWVSATVRSIVPLSCQGESASVLPSLGR